MEGEVQKNVGAEEKTTASTLGEISKILHGRYAFALAFVIVLLIAVYMRVGMLQYQGLFEPDGFYFYTIVMDAIHHGGIVQGYSPLSSFPVHTPRGEEPGTPFLSAFAYILFGGAVSSLTIMRLMPVLFGVLEVIGVYFVARYLFDNRAVGLIASFLLAISSGNIARTAALVYRGDSFISLIAIVVVLLLLKSLKEKEPKKYWAYAILSGFVLSLGILIWTGSPFIVATYLVAAGLLLAYSFVFDDKELMRKNLALAAGLLLAYLLEHAYVYTHLANGGITLFGIGFIGLYVPLLIGDFLVIGISRMNIQALRNPLGRLALFFFLALVVLLIMYSVLGSVFNGIIANTGYTVPTNVLNNANSSKSQVINTAVGITTQELQKPSFAFLFASFNISLFFAPLGIIIFLVLGGSFIAARKVHIGRIGVFLNESFLVLLSYLFVTSYLQAGAIRWNSLVSLPIAIFAAYGIYAVYALSRDKKINSKKLMVAAVAILDVLVVYFSVNSVTPDLKATGLPSIVAAAVIVNLILAYVIVEGVRGVLKNNLNLRNVYLGFIIALLIFNVYTAALQSYTATQADDVNPLFLQAMSWMKNNTPANSTVITLWPDGSVVEAWANRSSYMDSVAGENSTRIYHFSRFLFNTSNDPQYFYSIGKPDYLVVRNFWFAELGGIAQEGLVTNASAYGIDTLSSMNVSRTNSTLVYTFGSNTPPYYGARVEVMNAANNTILAGGFVDQNKGAFYPVKHVIFFDSTNGGYSILNSSLNKTLNYTVMISYSNNNITGASILGPDMPSSNLFKFTILCNYQECPFDSSSASLDLVYSNSDTKIFKILYNSTQ